MFSRRKKTARTERAIHTTAESVISGAEALLSGRLALLASTPRASPAWTCINSLGHADLDTLQSLARGGCWEEDRQWAAALGFLAAELRSIAPTPAELLVIQRAAILPLELDILAGAVTRPSTPAALVALVRPRLRVWRDPHRGHSVRLPPGR